MNTINENTLLMAINTCNTDFLNEAIKRGVSIKTFFYNNALYITEVGLEFLHSSFHIRLSPSVFILSYMSTKQLNVCLKHGCKINNDLILNFSMRTGLREFKLLYKNNHPIPDEVGLQWVQPQFIPALTYYLKHGGNPNIRAFAIKNKYQKRGRKIPVLLQMTSRSLIDEWHYNGNDKVVKLLQQYGGRLSPNAQTREQEDAENRLLLSDAARYVEIKKNQMFNVKNEYMLRKQTLDEETDKEYSLAIAKLENEIKLANDLLGSKLNRI